MPDNETLEDAVDDLRNIAQEIGAMRFSLCLADKHGNKEVNSFLCGSASRSDAPQASPSCEELPARILERLGDIAHPVQWGEISGETTTVENVSAPGGEAGILFPVSNEQRRYGAVIFAGGDIDLAENELASLHRRCYRIFSCAVRHEPEPEGKAPPAISKRELQCLKLSANGLTSEEIAKRVGLSVHTANQYLASATQKLNAVNRVHAVAKALRAGLID